MPQGSRRFCPCGRLFARRHRLKGEEYLIAGWAAEGVLIFPGEFMGKLFKGCLVALNL